MLHLSNKISALLISHCLLENYVYYIWTRVVATKPHTLLSSCRATGGRERTKGGAGGGRSSPKQMFPSFFKPKRQDIRQDLKEQLGTLNKYRHLNVTNYIHMLEFSKEDQGARLPAHADFQKEFSGLFLQACWKSDVILLNTAHCF